VNGSPDYRALLEEIRDLLIPISGVYRSQYEELLREERKETVDRITALTGKGTKRLGACQLMNGQRGRKQIIEASGIDGSELSKLIRSLRAQNLATEDGGMPRLVVDPAIVWKE